MNIRGGFMKLGGFLVVVMGLVANSLEARKWKCKDWHDGDYVIEAETQEEALKKCPTNFYGGLGDEVK